MSVAGGWGDLPWDLLLLITQHLEMADVIRLRAVCYQWAWAFGKTCDRIHPTLHDPFIQCHSSPWLLLPKASGKVADSCTFLSLFEDRFYTIPSLPQIVDRRIVGSSPDGWVVTVDPLFIPHLINPLTRQEVTLPSLSTLHTNFVPIYSEHDGSLSAVLYTGFDTTFPIDTITETFCDHYITKIVLTSSPLEGGFAIAICTFHEQESFFAVAAPEDEAWSLVYEFNRLDEFGMVIEEQGLESIEDVVYHEHEGSEMLYALSHCAAVLIFKLNCIGEWVIQYMMAARESIIEMRYWRRYIVLFRGEILHITRYMEEEDDGESGGVGNCQLITNAQYRMVARESKVCYWRRYIVLCRGEILQITRYMEEEDDGESGGDGNCQLITNGFQILKFDQVVHDRHVHEEQFQCPDESCWVRVDSLGDQSLFLGYNTTFMSYGDNKIGPQSNKIYFGDEKEFKVSDRLTFCDAGVYDMESKTIDYLCPSDSRHSIWYIPAIS